MELNKLARFIIDSQPTPKKKSVRVLFEENFNAADNKILYRITVASYTSAGLKSYLWTTGDLPSMQAAITLTAQHFTTPGHLRSFWGP